MIIIIIIIIKCLNIVCHSVSALQNEIGETATKDERR
jgi:hypothetical protein